MKRLVIVGKHYINVDEIYHVSNIGCSPGEPSPSDKSIWYSFNMKNGASFCVSEEDFMKFIKEHKEIFSV